MLSHIILASVRHYNTDGNWTFPTILSPLNVLRNSPLLILHHILY